MSVDLRRVSAPTSIVQLAAHLENSPLAVVEWNADFRVIYWSAQAERLFGWKESEVLGKHPSEWRFVFADDQEQVSRTVTNLLDGSASRNSSSNRNYTKAGSVIDCVWYNSGLFDASGKFVSVLSFVHDVTAQKRIEEQHAQLSAIVQSSDDAIIGKTLDGIITSWNPAAQRLYGYRVDEAVGQPMTLIIPPERQSEYRDILRKILQAERVERLETVRVRKDGSRLHVAVTVSPIRNTTGAVIGASAIARDITERKRTEDALRHAQEELLVQQQQETERVEAELVRVREQLVQQTRMAAVGQVSASIAHDLRNPLGAIRNAAYLLKRRLPTSDEKIGQYLRVVEEEVNVADTIIGDLLEMTRAKEPRKQRTDLLALVFDISQRLQPLSEVDWRCASEPDPFLVWADPHQLRQVLNNMLLNAVQAMGGQGVIEVTAARVMPWDEITITDTGPGIPPENVQRIFEPLFTTKAKGTGLGLAICKQIMEKHGGMIEVVNTGGVGAVFRLRFPHDGNGEA